jgi:hypothetical protein
LHAGVFSFLHAARLTMVYPSLSQLESTWEGQEKVDYAVGFLFFPLW